MTRQYRTVDGVAIALNDLTVEEAAFFDRCYRAYQESMDWADLSNLIGGTENPLLRATGGWVTPEVWGNPLFKALRDLEDRAGIRQGTVLPERGDDLEHDPITGSAISAVPSR